MKGLLPFCEDLRLTQGRSESLWPCNGPATDLPYPDQDGPAGPPAGRTMKKIAVIEDDLDLFSLLKYNLEKEGLQFVGTNKGGGVVDLCARERPDLVLLDIMLPDCDGLDVCKQIRKTPLEPVM
jgi:PleD family two-component response regulator